MPTLSPVGAERRTAAVNKEWNPETRVGGQLDQSDSRICASAVSTWPKAPLIPRSPRPDRPIQGLARPAASPGLPRSRTTERRTARRTRSPRGRPCDLFGRPPAWVAARGRSRSSPRSARVEHRGECGQRHALRIKEASRSSCSLSLTSNCVRASRIRRS
jgi:hypothetical protein